MFAERVGIVAALAAVLVLVGELAGAVVLEERFAAPRDERIRALQFEATTLDQVDVPIARANVHAVLNRAGY